jgi:catechol 2,3-dioxygenase-like lactoylglutathione lyase family enzyme
MDETVRFWTNVLKAKMVREGQDEGDPGSRHYYFDVGGALIAFFEIPSKDPEALKFGWMHHVALKAGSLQELKAYRDHIASFNVPVSDVREQDFVNSIYLHDPNGILVEVAAASRPLSSEDLKKDPKPVAALREMLA